MIDARQHEIIIVNVQLAEAYLLPTCYLWHLYASLYLHTVVITMLPNHPSEAVLVEGTHSWLRKLQYRLWLVSGLRWFYPITETMAVTLLYHINQKSMNILARGKPDPLKPVIIRVSLWNYHRFISLQSLFDWCVANRRDSIRHCCNNQPAKVAECVLRRSVDNEKTLLESLVFFSYTCDATPISDQQRQPAKKLGIPTLYIKYYYTAGKHSAIRVRT